MIKTKIKVQEDKQIQIVNDSLKSLVMVTKKQKDLLSGFGDEDLPSDVLMKLSQISNIYKTLVEGILKLKKDLLLNQDEDNQPIPTIKLTTKKLF